MTVQVDQQIREFAREAFVQRRVLAMMFAAVLVTSAVIGIGIHRMGSYVSATTILIEDKKMIAPLMQGAAVSASVTDQSKIAKELIFGRRIMNQLLDLSGLAKGVQSETDREDVSNSMQRRMRIATVASNLIRIEYRDSDAKRAQAVTQRTAELFVAEGTDQKIEESREAFKFIEAQTGEYLEKLTTAEQHLKEFRSKNVDARVGTEAEVGARITRLQQDIDTTRGALNDAEIRRDSIEKQLSGEAEIAIVVTREGQFRQRIAELQGQIDELRLNYHDTHPEIVRLKYQIDDLTNAMAEEHARRSKKGGGDLSENPAINSPVYLQLRTELSKVRTEADTLKGRLADYRRQLATELDRGRRVNVGEATLAEITRDYEVNRDIYHDLLRRRENARVSMNLGQTAQGPAFRIQEPANLPVQRTGLRLTHVLLAGFVLSLALPAAFVFAKLKFDPRIRRPALIAADLKLPILAVVPRFMARSDIVALKGEAGALLALMVIGVLAFAALGILRSVGAI